MKHDPSLWWNIQFSSITQSCLTLCDPMDCSTPYLPVHHQLPEFTQTHVHRVGDAIQPSHPLSSPSPPAFHLSQHQGLFERVSSSHQVVKVLEFQLQHQSFQWIFRTDSKLGKVYDKYYPSIKRNELLTHAATWRHLENIMPCDINQVQKNKHCMILLIRSTCNRQNHRDGK